MANYKVSMKKIEKQLSRQMARVGTVILQNYQNRKYTELRKMRDIERFCFDGFVKCYRHEPKRSFS